MLTYADVFQMLKKATQNKEVRYAKEIAAVTAKTHKSGVHATIQSRLKLLFDTATDAFVYFDFDASDSINLLELEVEKSC